MTNSPDALVLIHGQPWKLGDLKDSIADCRELEWVQKSWKPSPALVHRSGGRVSLYYGQKFDPAKIDLIPDGWNHDHCEICWWKLFDTEDAAHSVGYNSENRWICSECYGTFIATAM